MSEKKYANEEAAIGVVEKAQEERKQAEDLAMGMERERIATPAAPSRNDCTENCGEKTKVPGGCSARERRKKIAELILRVVSCLLAVFVFLGLLVDDRWVPVVGCAGIMTFVVMGAIIMDRFFRRAR